MRKFGARQVSRKNEIREVLAGDADLRTNPIDTPRRQARPNLLQAKAPGSQTASCGPSYALFGSQEAREFSELSSNGALTSGHPLKPSV